MALAADALNLKAQLEAERTANKELAAARERLTLELATEKAATDAIRNNLHVAIDATEAEVARLKSENTRLVGDVEEAKGNGRMLAGQVERLTLENARQVATNTEQGNALSVARLELLGVQRENTRLLAALDADALVAANKRLVEDGARLTTENTRLVGVVESGARELRGLMAALADVKGRRSGERRERMMRGIAERVAGVEATLATAVAPGAEADNAAIRQPPCADCGTVDAPRSACPICGKVVCRGCAEAGPRNAVTCCQEQAIRQPGGAQ